MKFKNILILTAVSMLAVFMLAGCPQEPSVTPPAPDPTADLASDPVLAAGANVTIPKWDVNAAAKSGLSAVSFSGGKTNINDKLIAAVADSAFFADKEFKNLIVFVENGVSKELIAEAESTYGELIMNNFPVAREASVLNSDGTTADAYAAATALFCGDVTKNGNLGLDKNDGNVSSFVDRIISEGKSPRIRGLVSNGDLADPFISGVYLHTNDFSDKSKIYETVFIPCDVPDTFISGKGSFDAFFSDGSAYKTNEVYKARRYLAKDFKDTVEVITQKRLFLLDAHPDANAVPSKVVSQLSGNIGRYDTTGDLPNFQQLVAAGISTLDAKNAYKKQKKGICLVVNDTAAEEYIKVGNKDAALRQIQNFDEGVAVACRFAFDNPDTIIVVTSGYVADASGITNAKAPVYVMGAKAANLTNNENFTLAELGKFLCSLE